MPEIIHSSYISDDFLCVHGTDTSFSDNYLTHTHDICELLFLKKGDMTYMVEGKSYRLSKNTLVISRPLETHAILCNTTCDYERYNILFNETRVGADIYCRIPDSISVINFNGNDLVNNLFKKMEYYCLRGENALLKNILQNLTEEVLYNILLSADETQQDTLSTANPVILQAIDYINANITTPLTIEAICSELYITKSHLHHLFITHLNISPKKYITAKRLHLAQKELLSGSSPTDVCARYGFANYSTFYRNYKQYFGTAPSVGGSAKLEFDLL